MKKILHIRLNVDEDFSPKAKFVFDNIIKVLGLEAKYYTRDTLEDIDIYYGVKTYDNYPVKIHRDIITSLNFHKKTVYKKEEINFVRYKNDYIPFLFSQKGNIYQASDNSVYIRKDLISSAFYLSSGWEEYIGTKENDKLSVQERFYFLPLIEIYADIIKTAMMQTTLRQIFVSKPKTQNYYNLSLIFNKDVSKSYQEKNHKEKYKEIQKIEHYRRKFIGNGKKYYYSVISNDETYSKLFKNVNKSNFNFEIYDIKNKDSKIPENLFAYNITNEHNLQKLYNSFSENNVSVAIVNYFSQLTGYKTLFSYPHRPFNFEKNKPYDFFIIPVALISGYLANNCKLENKFLNYELENFIKKQLKFGANIFLTFDIMEIYYKCSNNIKLFYKIKNCIKKLKKSGMKPITLDKIIY